jgi:hypothetical protein
MLMFTKILLTKIYNRYPLNVDDGTQIIQIGSLFLSVTIQPSPSLLSEFILGKYYFPDVSNVLKSRVEILGWERQ